MSPELIFASYSCARRDHMVRLTRARPLSVSSAFFTSAGSDSLRMPTLPTFAVALARPLVALRRAGAAFFVVLEALFLRVFCDTACARNCHAPVRCFYGNPPGPQVTHGQDRLIMCPI